MGVRPSAPQEKTPAALYRCASPQIPQRGDQRRAGPCVTANAGAEGEP
jgi:hypothetical protein